MPRSTHGTIFDFNDFRLARDALARQSSEDLLGFAVAARSVVTEDYDFLFPALQDDPMNLLPETSETLRGLENLGRTMQAGTSGVGSRGDAGIPAVYTYFGQFVDHDITLELKSDELADLFSPNLVPLARNDVKDKLQNARTATLELDSIYGGAVPRDENNERLMKIGKVSVAGNPIPGKDADNDLPRKGPSPVAEVDRVAEIGDPRNDENLIVAQMHVAFLRAHNELVERGARFREARKRLRRHYQHIVLHDFLKRIVDPVIVDDILTNGNRVYKGDAADLFMPLEFSVAAYRFGHSMVREVYNYNANFPAATLDELFMFTARSGEMENLPTLPRNWIIQWENLIDGGITPDMAHRIAPELVEPLSTLKDFDGQTLPGSSASLAVRNLLRGYLLRMPTGQAVARELGQRLFGVREVHVLEGDDLKAGAANPEQLRVLEEAGFLDRTPLWYYILAEAAILGEGHRLGPVGGTIVAEVLVGLVRRSENSILQVQDWKPSLPSAIPGTFTLNDLLSLAGVLD